MTSDQRYGILAMIVFCALSLSIGQTTFTRITDVTNPVVTDSPPSGYAGCSWIDYDNDGNLDLFINPNYLYRNLGNGNFARIPTMISNVYQIERGYERISDRLRQLGARITRVEAG